MHTSRTAPVASSEKWADCSTTIKLREKIPSTGDSGGGPTYSVFASEKGVMMRCEEGIRVRARWARCGPVTLAEAPPALLVGYREPGKGDLGRALQVRLHWCKDPCGRAPLEPLEPL